MRTDHPILTAPLRPLAALRGHVERITARTDKQARAAGLTVEAGPGGVRRYRDPRMGQLAARRAVGPYTGVRAAPAADVTVTAWSTPTLTVSATLARAGWSQ